MHTTTAYFAGVGTVAAAIAIGLGGGLLFSSIVAPHQPKYATEPTKLELRMAERSIPMSSPPAEPAPAIAVTPSTAPQAPASSIAAAPAEPQSQKASAAAEQDAAVVQPAPAAREPAASPREAFAKARDADLKRATTDKRRAERQQQWAEKRRARQSREDDLAAVEQAVRDDTEPRQAFASERVRLDTPRIKLFGDD